MQIEDSRANQRIVLRPIELVIQGDTSTVSVCSERRADGDARYRPTGDGEGEEGGLAGSRRVPWTK